MFVFSDNNTAKFCFSLFTQPNSNTGKILDDTASQWKLLEVHENIIQLMDDFRGRK